MEPAESGEANHPDRSSEKARDSSTNHKRHGSSKHDRHRSKGTLNETANGSDPGGGTQSDRNTKQSPRSSASRNPAKNPYAPQGSTGLTPRRFLRKHEEEYLAFSAEERTFPHGAAWAHGSLKYGSDLPDYGLVNAKTKLLQRVEEEVTGENFLITLTTPDTREVDGEELVFTKQADQMVDEGGKRRTGLVVPPKVVNKSPDRKGRRRAYSEGDKLSKDAGSKPSRRERSESGQRSKK